MTRKITLRSQYILWCVSEPAKGEGKSIMFFLVKL